ncbi:voltage-gated potassium channel protein [Vibrio sagamiensis]|nr:voltage-gated potassium channel protein [Vibrio sagamiensis]
MPKCKQCVCWISHIWKTYGYVIASLMVLLNSLLIFEAVFGNNKPFDVIYLVNNISTVDFEAVKNLPWFLLGVFQLLNCIGLFFKARVAWGMSCILLVVYLVFTAQYFPSLHINFYLGLATLAFMVIFRKSFHHSSATAGSIVAFISIIILIIYSTYGSLYFGEGFKPKINTMTTAFYFSLVTMTTVGYGDILPVSDSARLFCISMITAGIAVFATALSNVFGPLINKSFGRLIEGDKKTVERKDHFIICGTSAMAMNTVLRLRERGLPITIITIRPNDEFQQIEQSLEGKYDIISGDSCDTSVLKKAGLENCKAILALTDADADNAFIVLSAKEINAKAKTVVIVNDSKNMNKIKRVQPDVLLSPQLLGSEVLARLLNGESMDNNDLISMFLDSGKS